MERGELMSKKRPWYLDNVLVDAGLTMLESVLVRLGQKRLEKPKDESERLNELLDMLHKLFGEYVSIYSVKLTPGEHEVQLACYRCGQRNRLTHGFKNAICGKCRRPLVKGADTKTVN